MPFQGRPHRKEDEHHAETVVVDASRQKIEGGVEGQYRKGQIQGDALEFKDLQNTVGGVEGDHGIEQGQDLQVFRSGGKIDADGCLLLQKPSADDVMQRGMVKLAFSDDVKVGNSVFHNVGNISRVSVVPHLVEVGNVVLVGGDADVQGVCTLNSN